MHKKQFDLFSLPLVSHSFLQSSIASAGKSVVDGGTNQELQQENTRLKDRLARMVLYN